jgi:hypothetical protein
MRNVQRENKQSEIRKSNLPVTVSTFQSFRKRKYPGGRFRILTMSSVVRS